VVSSMGRHGSSHQDSQARCGSQTAYEAAWTYRYPARISRELLLRQEQLPKPIRDIAWKAQERLCRRYRKLLRAGKEPTVVVAAIARELSGFVWAIAKQTQPV
jgi:transposase